MSFFEVEFPRVISYRGTGGGTFNTTVNEGLSGFEQRNKNWATARGQWQVSLQTPAAFQANRQSFLDLLNAFFLNVTGMGDGFRLFDHIDFAAKSAFIAVSDGSTLTYQLQKQYSIGSGGLQRSYNRIINKPITSKVQDYQGNALLDTVVLYDNGTPIVNASGGNPLGNKWRVNETTGVVTFQDVSFVPAAGHVITADLQFHFPVRFDMDQMTVEVQESDVKDGNPIGAWANIALKELRIITGQSQG